MMEWLKARMVEKSTWAGLGVLVLAILSSFGITDLELQGNVKTVLEAIGALVGGILMVKNTTNVG